MNDEIYLTRTISLSTGTRLQSFRDSVRARDGKCMITGKAVLGAYRDHWKGFEAAHVFPLAHQGHWVSENFGRWITIPAANGETINSVQNGLLLRADIHRLFDNYDISINPDVCLPSFPEVMAVDCSRIITRSSVFQTMGIISPVDISIRNLFPVPIDQLMSSSAGTSGKRCLQI